MCAWILRELYWTQGYVSLWIKYADMVRDIQDHYGSDKSGIRLLAAKRTRILVLDDLGDPFRERGQYQETEDKRRILFELLAYRYEHGLLTFITSNFASPSELAEQFDPRIESRLNAVCTWVEMGGADLRALRGAMA